eukprot:TRINITY_DN25516_c0_g1_i1.p1 TRINITY_DN25516_c0_g1~~TRINITY_DN25516_c0_g1_i1.p1  ORF type:complete len:533 (-),score=89.49 TRINITY_DN25516_c0_g1_i1:59-1606(-)
MAVRNTLAIRLRLAAGARAGSGPILAGGRPHRLFASSPGASRASAAASSSSAAAAASPAPLGACGLPQHLCCEDGPGLAELAWFANQVYREPLDLGRTPDGFRGWTLDPLCSHSVPEEGVHMRTWRRGRDVVIAMRGTTPDELAALIGNAGLLLAHLEASAVHRFALPRVELPRQLDECLRLWGLEGLKGASRTRELIRAALDGHGSRADRRVWLTGHSRGSALAQHAALGLSSEVHAVVGFEGPGLPAAAVERAEQEGSEALSGPSSDPNGSSSPRVVRKERFVDYFTYPNLITLLHPCVNAGQRYHVPTRPQHKAGHSVDFVGRCLFADASRAANWVNLMAPVTRGLGIVAEAGVAGAEALRATSTAKALGAVAMGAGSVERFGSAIGLAMTLSGAAAVQRCAVLGSFAMPLEELRLVHSMESILEQLLRPGGIHEVRPIQSWPSDNSDTLGRHGVGLALRTLVDIGRDQYAFGQPDLPGIHQLLSGQGGAQKMWEERLRRVREEYAGDWRLA